MLTVFPYLGQLLIFNLIESVIFDREILWIIPKIYHQKDVLNQIIIFGLVQEVLLKLFCY